jgi:hypothetical protein
MSAIEITDLTRSRSTIRCEVTATGRLRRFFTGEPFLAEYDVDVESVPESVAVIPALSHLCPVAWANGADVHVPAVDERFLDSLRDVRATLSEMYPTFIDGGAIRAGSVEPSPDPSPPPDRPGLLFSGGVDSTASYVRHRDEEPVLVSVQGWVVDDDEEWDQVQSTLRRFATARGLDHHSIRSNMLSALDTGMLQAHYKRYVDGAWYSSVGHGLGLLGLCAPLTESLGLGTLYIAATHWEGTSLAWGSHPRIDDAVAWRATTARHDGYELTRQERLELVTEYAESTPRQLELRTCNVTPTDNCGRCEKCCRTIVGLVLAGADPTEYGYPLDPETFEHARDRLIGGDWTLGMDEFVMWSDLQTHVPETVDCDVPGATPFLRWLPEADLAAIVSQSNPPIRDRLVRAVARNTPSPIYVRLRSRIRADD